MRIKKSAAEKAELKKAALEEAPVINFIHPGHDFSCSTPSKIRPYIGNPFKQVAPPSILNRGESSTTKAKERVRKAETAEKPMKKAGKAETAADPVQKAGKASKAETVGEPMKKAGKAEQAKKLDEEESGEEPVGLKRRVRNPKKADEEEEEEEPVAKKRRVRNPKQAEAKEEEEEEVEDDGDEAEEEAEPVQISKKPAAAGQEGKRKRQVDRDSAAFDVELLLCGLSQS